MSTVADLTVEDSIDSGEKGWRSKLKLPNADRFTDWRAKLKLPHFDNSLDERSKLNFVITFCQENLLIILLLTSLLLSFFIGCVIKFGAGTEFTPKEIGYISFPGTLFLNSLKMVIIPLIVSSLITGMASLNRQASGKLGRKAIFYYLSTTLFAAILGIIMVCMIQPGRGRDSDDTDKEKQQEVDTVDALFDLLRNLVPPNIVAACFQTYKTTQTGNPMGPENSTVTTQAETTPMMNNSTSTEIDETKGGFEPKTNMIGLVAFSCVLGAIIGRMGRQGEPLKIFFNAFMEAVMRIVGIIIWFSPLGIFFLILGKILDMNTDAQTFQKIGMFSLTVVLGLAIHAFIVLPLIYFILTRKNPWLLLKGVSPALMTAFATASSSATLPVTLTCLEQNLKIDLRVTRFILPIGATINMDGTALYEAVAAIFIAQLHGSNLGAAKIIAISIIATLASVGAAGVPQAGVVTLIVVLNAVGLPADDISLILVIDWFLDRCRTTINVWGDSIGAGIIYERSKDALDSMSDLPLEMAVKEDNNAAV